MESRGIAEDGLSNTIFVFEQAGKPSLYRTAAGRAFDVEVEPYDPAYIGTAPYYAGMWAFYDPWVMPDVRSRGDRFGGAINNDNLDGVYSFHPAGANVLFGDTHVRLLPKSTDPAVLIGLLSRDGGEAVGAGD